MRPALELLERRYSLLCLAMVSLYAATVYAWVPDASWTTLYLSYARPILSFALFFMMCYWLVSVAIFAWRTRLKQSPIAHFYHRLRTDGVLMSYRIVWPVLTLIILMPAFNVFKQRLLPLAGFHWDAQFRAADSVLFGESDLGLVWMSAIDSVTLTQLLDMAYHAWFFPMVLGVVMMGYFNAVALRLRYMLSFVLAWILLGSVMAYALPATGPFLQQSHGALAHLQQLEAHQVAVGKLHALTYQAYLVATMDSPQVVIGGGISAMPSMHNAFALLFALVMWQRSRLLGALLVGYALVIFVGSVYLAWHYAIDGVVAWLLMWLVWAMSGRLFKRSDESA